MTLPAAMWPEPVAGLGGSNGLVWRDDIAVPRPGPGEVLVRVLAAGVNIADVPALPGACGEGRSAVRFPRLHGADLCGRIVALGEGVAGLPIGARVMCPSHLSEAADAAAMAVVTVGGERAATYCVVNARHLRDVRTSALTSLDFGAMPCAYGTAHNLLSRAQVAVGERVLVTGASGGVGLAAVQLAMLRGAEVTGQCSLSKSAPLRAMNAGVLARDSKPAPKSFDVVIDVLGGEGWQDRLDALHTGGRYATSGAVAGPMIKGDLCRVYLNDLTVYGATHQPREVFAGLVTIITTARLRPVAVQTRGLTRTAQAYLTTGRSVRTPVLVPLESLP